jgi:hypothetical protein
MSTHLLYSPGVSATITAKTSDPHRKRHVFWKRLRKSAGTVTALATVGLAVIGVLSLLNLGPSTSAAPDDLAGEVTIDAPDVPVPRCAMLRGSAPTLDGRRLWIGIRGEAERYYFRRVEYHREGRWEVITTVGGVDDEEKPFNIYAFYLNEDLSLFLGGLVAQDDQRVLQEWHTADLPPTVAGIVDRVIYRDGTPNADACPD